MNKYNGNQENKSFRVKNKKNSENKTKGYARVIFLIISVTIIGLAVMFVPSLIMYFLGNKFPSTN